MCSEHRLAYSWTKLSNTKPILNEVLGVSCNLLYAVSENQNGCVFWTYNHSGFHLQHTISVWAVHPHNCVPDQGLRLCLCPVSWERSVPQIASLGKDHSSKSISYWRSWSKVYGEYCPGALSPFPLRETHVRSGWESVFTCPFHGSWVLGFWEPRQQGEQSASGSAHGPWEKMDFWWWLWTKQMLERVGCLNSASFGIFYWSSG